MNVSSTMAVAILSLLGAALWAPPALSADGPRLIRPLGKRPPPRCVEGYVWREAYAGDVVCVDPPRRDAVHTENAMAAQRVEP
ncbi:MAG TPA: hypothetical protein VJ743_18735, partial [Albitalea sp.]|nr:hypothetical protein [Albitalea sp.]